MQSVVTDVRIGHIPMQCLETIGMKEDFTAAQSEYAMALKQTATILKFVSTVPSYLGKRV